jgi:Zn-dependent protease with chaperone function
VTIAAERICAVVDRRRRLGDVAGSSTALFAARQLLQASCSRDAERNADAFAVVTMQRLGRSSAPLGELLMRVTGDERSGASPSSPHTRSQASGWRR